MHWAYFKRNVESDVVATPFLVSGRPLFFSLRKSHVKQKIENKEYSVNTVDLCVRLGSCFTFCWL